MERWFSTDYSTTVCRNLMIRSADPAWKFNFDRIKEKKCDKGGKNESLFFSSNFHKGRADSAHGSSPCPCQGRSPWRCLQAWQSWFSLQPFPTSYVLELEDASSHWFVAAKSSPLFYIGHTSLGAWRTRRSSCDTTWWGPWDLWHTWIAFCMVNSCSPTPGQPQPDGFYTI